MPWIPMYLYKSDLDIILDRLNNDPEIAFIIPNGDSKREREWVAVPNIETLQSGDYVLWHIHGAPLSIPADRRTNRYVKIADPWAGWSEIIPGSDSNIPFFGSHPATIKLSLREHGLAPRDAKPPYMEPNKRSDDIIGMSSFGWIGQRYKSIGQPATHATELWWRRLKQWVARNATQIPRWDGPGNPPPEINAFPCAYKAIQNDRPRDFNPV